MVMDPIRQWEDEVRGTIVAVLLGCLIFFGAASWAFFNLDEQSFVVRVLLAILAGLAAEVVVGFALALIVALSLAIVLLAEKEAKANGPRVGRG